MTTAGIRRQWKRSRREPGAFSAVELLILVAAALVLAGLTVPVLRGMTLATNEESARETLVRLRDYQIRYREKGVSQTPLGEARFGSLTELLRAGLSLEDSSVVGGTGDLDSGLCLLRHGYLFQFFFHTRSGGFTTLAADPLVAESKNAFVVYAWPEVYRRGGASTFVIDPSALLRPNAKTGILESKNLLANYSGLKRPPKAFSAARPADTTAPRAPETAPASGPVKPVPRNERGEDGEMWELTPFPTSQ
jgi:hypothetical protein